MDKKLVHVFNCHTRNLVTNRSTKVQNVKDYCNER